MALTRCISESTYVHVHTAVNDKIMVGLGGSGKSKDIDMIENKSDWIVVSKIRSGYQQHQNRGFKECMSVEKYLSEDAICKNIIVEEAGLLTM